MTDAQETVPDTDLTEDPILLVNAPATTIPGLHLRFSLDEKTAVLLKTDGNKIFSSPRRGVTRNSRQVFWDNEARLLGRAGIALGLQTTGQKRVQIVRDIRAIPAAGRIAVPYESSLTSDTLDITRVAFFPGIAPDLVGELTTAILLPVFGIDLTRTQWRSTLGETELTVSLDRAIIETSNGRETHIQLEIALTSGLAEGLYQFARQLIGTLPLTLATRDPIQHGYRLASNKDWWEGTVGEPILADDESVRSGFLVMARAGTAALRQEIALLSTQFAPERIHQARVALRRLRSLLSVFQSILPAEPRVRFSATLNAIATALGEAREWDVLIESTVIPLSNAIDPDAGLDYVVSQATRRRNVVVKRLKSTLPGPDFMLLCLDLGAWFDIGIWPEPPTAAAQAILDAKMIDFAKTLLRQRHRKLVAAAIHNPTIGELHILRIEAKKLRYTAEFLRSLFSAKTAKAYMTSLKDIQEILGTVNDAAMAQILIPQLVDATDPKGAKAIGLITGWTAANANNARDRFDRVWEGFQETKRFWR